MDCFLCFLIMQCKHPSALSSFAEITNLAKGKEIAVFLDYDGTLSPIVDDPDRAVMSDDVRTYTLRNFAVLRYLFCDYYSIELLV